MFLVNDILKKTSKINVRNKLLKNTTNDSICTNNTTLKNI